LARVVTELFIHSRRLLRFPRQRQASAQPYALLVAPLDAASVITSLPSRPQFTESAPKGSTS
jgi:hypothetical protein